jgi:AIG2-like family
VKVFFYGLFMDQSLLKSRGIRPAEASVGFVDGYGLRIGERATLVRRPDGRAYGAMMDITPGEAEELYAEDSVADYIPESVTVELLDGTQVEATCYNLPSDKVTGANKDYANSLLDVAIRLGFPDSYLEQIRRART